MKGTEYVMYGKTKQGAITENENCFGETLGNEHYIYFGECTRRWGGRPRGKYTQRYAYYKNKFFYLKRVNGTQYLWMSNEDGTMPKIIKHLEEPWTYAEIFVNQNGIFLSSKYANNFSLVLLDFEGNEKASIESHGEIKWYYICDNKVFLISHNKALKSDTVSYFDVETQVMHTILTTSRRELGENSCGEKSYTNTSVNYIMANKKRVVMWIEFSYYNYPEDSMDFEHLYEDDTAGWYNYDFTTHKLTCLNSLTLPPHQLLTSPEKFKEWNWEEKHVWIPIAYFDMQKDIMWTIRKNSSTRCGEIWEPRNIGIVSKQNIIQELPVWKVDKPPSSNRHYFDGIHRYSAPDCNSLFSYTPAGKESVNWNGREYSACDDFQKCGDYLFFRKEYWQEGQYKLTHEPKNIIRYNWMAENSRGSLSPEEEAAFEKFCNKEKQRTMNILNRGTDKNVSVTKTKFSKIAYWEEFVTYAFEDLNNKDFKDANFPKVIPTDRNWYALRLGTSKARIELSFNTRENTIRTALFISDKEKYRFLENIKNAVNKIFQNLPGDVVWDGNSKTPSISMIRREMDTGINRTEQFDWFMECACLLNQITRVLLEL